MHHHSKAVCFGSFQDEIREVELDKIVVNPFQPRQDFSQEELQDLATSIQTVGLVHPPVVRIHNDGTNYELVSGERRLKACRLAGLSKISVIVRSTTSQISAEAALIENIQRVDLNSIEIAKALRSLIDQFGYHQDELAQRIGKKRSTVANYLRLLGLPKNIQQSLMNGQITMGHAKAILSLEGEKKQNLFHEQILTDHLNVRETEKEAFKISKKSKKQTSSNRDFFLQQLENKVQEKLGTKVSIKGKGNKGQIVIDYYNLDDLDRVLELLGISCN